MRKSNCLNTPLSLGYRASFSGLRSRFESPFSRYTAISIEIVHEQSGKAEYERETLEKK
jgi:hypothetical protein